MIILREVTQHRKTNILCSFLARFSRSISSDVSIQHGISIEIREVERDHVVGVGLGKR